jgi:hypothetical protein
VNVRDSFTQDSLYSDSQATSFLSASYNGVARPNICMRIDVLAVVNFKVTIFWDVSLLP